MARPRKSHAGHVPYTIHATKKLLTRLGRASEPIEPGSTALGAWYANPIPWRRPLVLLVNETTLLPVLMPLAPAATVIQRFPAALAEVLRMHQIDELFIEAEMAQMDEGRLARTVNRSTTGILVEFAFMMDHARANGRESDLLETARWLGHTPCSALYKTHTSPDRALAALVRGEAD